MPTKSFCVPVIDSAWDINGATIPGSSQIKMFQNVGSHISLCNSYMSHDQLNWAPFGGYSNLRA